MYRIQNGKVCIKGIQHQNVIRSKSHRIRCTRIGIQSSRKMQSEVSHSFLARLEPLARFVFMATLSQMPSNNVGSCTFEKAVRLRTFSPKHV